MALTVATGDGITKGRSVELWGTRRVSVFRVTLDTSYPSNGYAFDPKAFGHQGKVADVLIFPRFSSGATGAAGRIFQYDHTNKKILAFQQKDPAAAGGADIQLPEVGNATSLAAVVLTVLVLSD
jgi:hypothetical protein